MDSSSLFSSAFLLLVGMGWHRDWILLSGELMAFVWKFSMSVQSWSRFSPRSQEGEVAKAAK
jgi:hypothetical protein